MVDLRHGLHGQDAVSTLHDLCLLLVFQVEHRSRSTDLVPQRGCRVERRLCLHRMRRPTVRLISTFPDLEDRGMLYRRHLSRRERDVLIEIWIRDPMLLSSIRRDERSRDCPDDIVMSNKAAEQLEAVISLQWARELLAVDEDSIAFCECMSEMQQALCRGHRTCEP